MSTARSTAYPDPDSITPSHADESAHLLHGSKRYEVLAAVMVVMFFSSMAATVVSTALPNIIADLHGLSLYAWVFTAFILASAIVIPIYGKLSDVFGRKPMFVVAIGLYLVGNVLAGFAQNMEVLIAARAIAGMGGGGMQALAQITAPRVLGGFIVGTVGLIVFVWQESRFDEPIISPAFFRNGIFVVSMLASFCVALGMYGSIMFVPLFVQGVIGTSAQDSGLVLAPMMIGFIAGSTVSGQLVSRFGRYRLLALTGLAVACAGMFLYGLMDVHSSNLTIVRNMLVFGVGLGSTMPLYTIAVQNAFPYRVLGAVTGARQFFMSLGGAIGVPIMGALLNSGFKEQFTRHLSPGLLSEMQRQHTAAVDPNTLISAEAQKAIRANFAHMGAGGPALYHQFIFAVRDALALTMQPLFHLALAFLLAALVVTLFLKEIPLRQHRLEPEAVVAGEAASIVSAPKPLRRSGT